MSKLARRAAAPPPAIEVIDALMHTTHRLRRFAGSQMGGSEQHARLSPPRIRVMVRIGRERVRMVDVARDLGITPRTVTTLVDALEEAGILRRLPDPDDRRATLLELTESGVADLERIRAAQARVAEQALSPLSGAERAQLLDVLQKVRRALPGGDALSDDDAECP